MLAHHTSPVKFNHGPLQDTEKSPKQNEFFFVGDAFKAACQSKKWKEAFVILNNFVDFKNAKKTDNDKMESDTDFLQILFEEPIDDVNQDYENLLKLIIKQMQNNNDVGNKLNLALSHLILNNQCSKKIFKFFMANGMTTDGLSHLLIKQDNKKLMIYLSELIKKPHDLTYQYEGQTVLQLVASLDRWGYLEYLIKKGQFNIQEFYQMKIDEVLLMAAKSKDCDRAIGFILSGLAPLPEESNKIFLKKGVMADVLFHLIENKYLISFDVVTQLILRFDFADDQSLLTEKTVMEIAIEKAYCLREWGHVFNMLSFLADKKEQFVFKDADLLRALLEKAMVERCREFVINYLIKKQSMVVENSDLVYEKKWLTMAIEQRNEDRFFQLLIDAKVRVSDNAFNFYRLDFFEVEATGESCSDDRAIKMIPQFLSTNIKFFKIIQAEFYNQTIKNECLAGYVVFLKKVFSDNLTSFCYQKRNDGYALLEENLQLNAERFEKVSLKKFAQLHYDLLYVVRRCHAIHQCLRNIFDCLSEIRNDIQTKKWTKLGLLCGSRSNGMPELIEHLNKALSILTVEMKEEQIIALYSKCYDILSESIRKSHSSRFFQKKDEGTLAICQEYFQKISSIQLALPPLPHASVAASDVLGSAEKSEPNESRFEKQLTLSRSFTKK